jgi:hypothetical protein
MTSVYRLEEGFLERWHLTGVSEDKQEWVRQVRPREHMQITRDMIIGSSPNRTGSS